MKKIEAIFTIASKLEVLEIKNDPILIGSSSKCNIIFNSNSNLPISVIFNRSGDKLEVSVLDPELKIDFFGKEHQRVFVNESAYFKIGTIDVIVNFEEISSKITSNEVEKIEGITEVFEISNAEQEEMLASEETVDAINELPVFPEDSSSTHEEEVIARPSTEPEVDNSHLVEVDGEFCDIIFDETDYTPLFNLPISNVEYDYSGYNDPFEDGPKAEGTSIFEESSGYSLHFCTLNNGVLLDSKFFDLNTAQIYLSSTKNSKYFFQVHDLPFRKVELISNQSNTTYITCPEHYSMATANGSQVDSIEEKTIVFPKTGRVVLTKGTSQIILQITETPPKLEEENPDFDEKLLKTQGMAWSLAILFILFIWILGDIPEITNPEQKEVVVIYKRVPKKNIPTPKEKDKKEKVEEEVKAVSQAVADSTPKKTKNNENQKKKNLINKKSQSQKSFARSKHTIRQQKSATNSKVSKKVETKKAPQKVYSFNVASSMQKQIGTSSNNLAAVKSQKAYVTDVSQGTSENRDISVANIRAQGVSAQGFSASEVGKINVAKGARGLGSNKNGTATAYVETNTRVLGAIDPELIRKLLREYIPQFRYCYQRELNLNNNEFKGVFDLYFQINAAGRGNKVSIKTKGPGFGPSGVKCIQKVIGMIQFPRPKGGGVVDVKQPMNFFSNKR